LSRWTLTISHTSNFLPNLPYRHLYVLIAIRLARQLC